MSTAALDGEAVEAVARRGRQLREVKRQVFELQLQLVALGAPNEQLLSFAKAFLKAEHVDAVVEERALLDRCGWPCCAKRNLLAGKNSSKKYLVCDKGGKVLELAELGRFCGVECMRETVRYKETLSNEPIWATVDKDVAKVHPEVRKKVQKDLRRERAEYGAAARGESSDRRASGFGTSDSDRKTSVRAELDAVLRPGGLGVPEGFKSAGAAWPEDAGWESELLIPEETSAAPSGTSVSTCAGRSIAASSSTASANVSAEKKGPKTSRTSSSPRRGHDVRSWRQTHPVVNLPGFRAEELAAESMRDHGREGVSALGALEVVERTGRDTEVPTTMREEEAQREKEAQVGGQLPSIAEGPGGEEDEAGEGEAEEAEAAAEAEAAEEAEAAAEERETITCPEAGPSRAVPSVAQCGVPLRKSGSPSTVKTCTPDLFEFPLLLGGESDSGFSSDRSEGEGEVGEEEDETLSAFHLPDMLDVYSKKSLSFGMRMVHTLQRWIRPATKQLLATSRPAQENTTQESARDDGADADPDGKAKPARDAARIPRQGEAKNCEHLAETKRMLLRSAERDMLGGFTASTPNVWEQQQQVKLLLPDVREKQLREGLGQRDEEEEQDDGATARTVSGRKAADGAREGTAATPSRPVLDTETGRVARGALLEEWGRMVLPKENARVGSFLFQLVGTFGDVELGSPSGSSLHLDEEEKRFLLCFFLEKAGFCGEEVLLVTVANNKTTKFTATASFYEKHDVDAAVQQVLDDLAIDYPFR